MTVAAALMRILYLQMTLTTLNKYTQDKASVHTAQIPAPAESIIGHQNSAAKYETIALKLRLHPIPQRVEYEIMTPNRTYTIIHINNISMSGGPNDGCFVIRQTSPILPDDIQVITPIHKVRMHGTIIRRGFKKNKHTSRPIICFSFINIPTVQKSQL